MKSTILNQVRGYGNLPGWLAVGAFPVAMSQSLPITPLPCDALLKTDCFLLLLRDLCVLQQSVLRISKMERAGDGGGVDL